MQSFRDIGLQPVGLEPDVLSCELKRHGNAWNNDFLQGELMQTSRQLIVFDPRSLEFVTMAYLWNGFEGQGVAINPMANNDQQRLTPEMQHIQPVGYLLPAYIRPGIR
jgi:hypothetical protein